MFVYVCVCVCVCVRVCVCTCNDCYYHSSLLQLLSFTFKKKSQEGVQTFEIRRLDWPCTANFRFVHCRRNFLPPFPQPPLPPPWIVHLHSALCLPCHRLCAWTPWFPPYPNYLLVCAPKFCLRLPPPPIPPSLGLCTDAAPSTSHLCTSAMTPLPHLWVCALIPSSYLWVFALAPPSLWVCALMPSHHHPTPTFGFVHWHLPVTTQPQSLGLCTDTLPPPPNLNLWLCALTPTHHHPTPTFGFVHWHPPPPTTTFGFVHWHPTTTTHPHLRVCAVTSSHHHPSPPLGLCTDTLSPILQLWFCILSPTSHFRVCALTPSPPPLACPHSRVCALTPSSPPVAHLHFRVCAQTPSPPPVSHPHFRVCVLTPIRTYPTLRVCALPTWSHTINMRFVYCRRYTHSDPSPTPLKFLPWLPDPPALYLGFTATWPPHHYLEVCVPYSDPHHSIWVCALQKIQQKQTSAISGGSSGYPSLQAMVLSEVSSRQHTNSNSATVALRWLKRWVGRWSGPLLNLAYSYIEIFQTLHGDSVAWSFFLVVSMAFFRFTAVVQGWTFRFIFLAASNPVSMTDECALEIKNI